MSDIYATIFNWEDIEISHLLYAYRKAKADCFFDRTMAMAEQLSFYEEALADNLERLLRYLKAGAIGEVLRVRPDQVRVVAKKLATEPKPDDHEVSKEGHAFFSDSERAFRSMVHRFHIKPEFRLIGHFDVEIHILSALWVNTVGAKLDAKLAHSSYGSRLRRVRGEAGLEARPVGAMHVESLGSFEPYFLPYRKWREGGLKAIRQELKAERQVVALSLDFASYYHQIDPSFLASERFLKTTDVELTDWETAFNWEFSRFLSEWSRFAGEKLTELGASIIGARGGLPIGLAATRVIANTLLAELDRDIETGLAPVYYGRYVDDIFLVIRDPGHLDDSVAALRYIAKRVAAFPDEIGAGPIQLRLSGGYQGDTILALQPSKQKSFFLSGRSGLDLLDSIEAQIRSVSSERRLMPSPDRLSSMASAKVLSAAGNAAEEADTLRRADGLSVRRLSWALQLRAVEILARDLRRGDWQSERNEFYRFSLSHILRPDKILDHFDYLPRLLSLAVAMTDWNEAKRLFEATLRALAELEAASQWGARVSGIECASSGAVWSGIRDTACDLAREAVLTSLRWDPATCEPHPLPSAAKSLCRDLGISDLDIYMRALKLREADLAKTPYKQHIRLAAKGHRAAVSNESHVVNAYRHLDDMIDFLVSCEESPNAMAASRSKIGLRVTEGGSPSLLPYVFPTRPYTTQEISLFLPEKCVVGDELECAKNWARYTRALRGIWVWGQGVSMPRHQRSKATVQGALAGEVAYLGGTALEGPIRLGISSLLTDEASWSAAASGRSDISPARYKRIETVVNHAVVANPRPDYLLLPELSLPERWIDTVSGVLSQAGIGLIAGLDYQLPPAGGVHSSAVLVLADLRLGYPANVEVRQVKAQPAPGEDKTLQHMFGLKWTGGLKASKPVYIHNGFTFGVLICSELQNVSHRLEFQGDVDCMMVLSWNKDIETFAALVDSSSLDVHANIALVNNRMYGDSRVRTPAKQSHLRDTCRLRGGKNDHVVVVELRPYELRAFQSRANRWPDDSDRYKPVPEDFEIAEYRRTIPE